MSTPLIKSKNEMIPCRIKDHVKDVFTGQRDGVIEGIKDDLIRCVDSSTGNEFHIHGSDCELISRPFIVQDEVIIDGKVYTIIGFTGDKAMCSSLDGIVYKEASELTHVNPLWRS